MKQLDKAHDEAAAIYGQRPDGAEDGDKGEKTAAWLEKTLKYLYDKNPHVRVLKIRLAEVKAGAAVMTMPVVLEVHGNLYGMVHGGALASLADTTMGVACASTGKRVVTLEMNINYIAGAEEGETVTAASQLIHNGKTTMVVECEITNTAGRLLAKARGTFFVIGEFEHTQE